MKTQRRHQRIPHRFSIEKAHSTQLRASELIIQEDRVPREIRYVAGVDVAYTAKKSIGVATVLDYKSLLLVESKIIQTDTRFPYIATLLSFREIPPIVAATRKLQTQPDIILVDGHGLMHPFRLGLASHLGLVTGFPTIGVAKNQLTGKVGDFNDENWAPIIDKDQIVGVALKPRSAAKPIYVSVGHLISLERAIEVVEYCTGYSRIPKPIRLAHKLATQEKEKSCAE